MLISDQQHQANQQNAQHSTGPTSPEGKAAVRLNALTYGLRARSTLLPGESPEEYDQLWNDLLSDWQPHNRTERLYLEQMAVSQWLLARLATGENDIYQHETSGEKQSPLLDRVAARRTGLERSFTSAMRELKQLQKDRLARQPQPAQPAQTAQAAQAPHPQPPYVMSERAENHPVFCAPVTPDTR
jgi:hypothetical protein